LRREHPECAERVGKKPPVKSEACREDSKGKRRMQYFVRENLLPKFLREIISSGDRAGNIQRGPGGKMYGSKLGRPYYRQEIRWRGRAVPFRFAKTGDRCQNPVSKKGRAEIT